MTEQASDLEESVKADVFLMGSFQYTEEANDIDLGNMNMKEILVPIRFLTTFRTLLIQKS